MARTKSAHQMWRSPHTGRTCPSTHALIGMISLLLLLSGTTVRAETSGPGIAVKVGAQTFENPVDLEDTTRARLDLEVSSPLLWDDHVDFAVSFGGSYAGTYRETYTDYVDGMYIDDLYTDRLWLFDIRLAARLYPLGDLSSIRPYLGAGIGYFWFRDNWENEYSDTYADPQSPIYGDTIHSHAEGDATLAKAPFPFVLAGVTSPLGENVEVLFEFQYDIDKKNRGYDLSGPIYSLGARFRF